MNAGKRFEAKVRKSLSRLGGYALRLHDGGSAIVERTPGDFLYFAKSGHACLIECKATSRPSLEHDRVTQIDDLIAFARVSDMTRAFVAVNFYGANVRQKNRCIIVPAESFAAHALRGDRKSLPIADAIALGWEAPVVKGNVWDLSRLERL